MKKGWGIIFGVFIFTGGALWAFAAEPVQMQSPDGRYLATAIATHDGSAIVMRDLQYEKTGGAGALVIPVNKTPIVAIAFNADGHEMTTKDADGVERTWQIARGGAATLITTTHTANP